MSERQDQEQLLHRIEQRRQDLNAYLRRARPRSERLTLASIISSAIAATLTAGPALGGTDFTSSVADALGLPGAPAVWRPLCLLATIVSVVAAVTANLSKSKNAEARIMSAETCNTELDLLATFLELHQVPLDDAVKLYQQTVIKVPFVEVQSDHPADHGSHARNS